MTPTTPTPTTTTDDFVRTTRNLRFTALGGFVVLAGLLFFTALLVLGDGISGDGVGGGFTTAAYWMFPFAAAAGLVALITPRSLMPTTPRRALVIAQYALGVVGVFLQTLD